MNTVSDFVNRLFELQNQLDQNLIKEQKDVSSLYSSFDESEVVSAIKNINAESSIATGFGVEKTGYRFLNHVILCYGLDEGYISPKAKQEFTQNLKEVGVSTPALLYSCYQTDISKDGFDDLIYEVQQSAIGSPIGFNTTSHFVNYLNSLENKTVLKYDSHPLFTELIHKYNLNMMKSPITSNSLSPYLGRYMNTFSPTNWP